jgi:PH (Pleckstrin Homology) domain-containing protein
VSKQVFRSPIAVVVWWVWVLFAVGNLIDLAVQGHDHASLMAAFVILAVTGAFWVGARRPRLIADDDGLTIVNPLRDHHVGWAAIAAIDTTDLIRVRCEWPGESGGQDGRKTIYAWAVGSSRRSQAIAAVRAERRSRSRRGVSIGVFGAMDASAAPGASEAGDADKIVASLRARAGEAQAGTSQAAAARPVSIWYWPAFAAVGVPVLALLIAIFV